MKKNLFILGIAALAFAACSNDEVVEVNQGNAINFRTFVGGVTRAADINASNLSSFVVEAFNTGTQTSPYFSNVTFTESSGTYSSATAYYWPENNLDFYAYAPVSSGQYSKTNFKTFVITPSTTVSEQVDFVYANTNNKGKGSTGEVTTLNFRHAGAKIAVKVKNSAPNLKFEVSGWKVGYLDGSATFTYGYTGETTTDTKNNAQLMYGDWTDNTTYSASNTYSVTTTSANAVAAETSEAQYLGASALSDTETESYSMILVPQRPTAATAYASAGSDALPNGSYIALKLKILNNTSAAEVVADATTKWAMWPVSFNWSPGKKYTYIIDLADGGYWETNNDSDADLDPVLAGAIIKFVSVTVDDWNTTSPAGDINVPAAPAAP